MVKPKRNVGLDLGVWLDAGFRAIAVELAANHVLGAQGADASEHLGLLIAHSFDLVVGRRLHGDVAQQLQKVVLDDVANGAGLIVKRPPPLHPEILRHIDLHTLHVLAVPDGLEKSVGEAEEDHVLHFVLAQIVIDAENVLLRRTRRAGFG